MTKPSVKERAPRNRTIVLLDEDRARLRQALLSRPVQVSQKQLLEGVAQGNFEDWTPYILPKSVNLLFLDPPYNLTKDFNGLRFNRKEESVYTAWLDTILVKLVPLLAPNATIYLCGDWRTSHSIYEAASRHFLVRNRITWEREKGRGAKTNWKNSSEDIWFCTLSNDYYFDVDSVKLRRKVIAPYKTLNGKPKDWQETADGNYRDTHPSNLWTDISIPFWSMPENTDHPTQKSEKLLAKLILASSRPGDFIFDPFLGSGTTCVVAKKLGRKCLGTEINDDYCLLALKRLEMIHTSPVIQGYTDGVFWERNTLSEQIRRPQTLTKQRNFLGTDAEPVNISETTEREIAL